MSDTKTITIAEETFEVRTPYAEGHILTAAEAKVLNQTRCENVSNNTRKKVKELLDAGDKAGAAAAVAAYDAEYEFTLQNAGGATKLDPIDREARKVAREALKAKIAQAGGKWADYDKEMLEDKIIEISETNEAVRKEAEKRVKAQSKFTDAIAGELSL